MRRISTPSSHSSCQLTKLRAPRATHTRAYQSKRWLPGLLVLLLGGCAFTQQPLPNQIGVPVTAVLDPTSRLYEVEQLVVSGYLLCFDDLTRLYATYDEAKRASLLNSITVVKAANAAQCGTEGEIELAHCSYRGRMNLANEYANPQLTNSEFLQCTDFGEGG